MIINHSLKDFYFDNAIELLKTHFLYDEEEIKKFRYAFTIIFHESYNSIFNENKKHWKALAGELAEDESKRAYFTGMYTGFQIMKTLQEALNFEPHELEQFEKIFINKVNFSHEQQTHKREKN